MDFKLSMKKSTAKQRLWEKMRSEKLYGIIDKSCPIVWADYISCYKHTKEVIVINSCQSVQVLSVHFSTVNKILIPLIQYIKYTVCD